MRLLAVLLAALAFASVPGALSAARPTDPPSISVAPIRIDVNTAPVDELAALPGVGPALARRIADGRRLGPFAGPEDLRRVPGIGPSLVARIAPHAEFDPAPPDK